MRTRAALESELGPYELDGRAREAGKFEACYSSARRSNRSNINPIFFHKNS